MTTEIQEQTQVTYSDLIDQAYITPIRSVLIIDDQYPTWDDWLTGGVDHRESGKVKGKNWADLQQIKTLIDTFRNMNPALAVDIHNGNNVNGYLRDYIHQSDLLILDYELDPENFPGEKFLKISSTLLEKSNHFNLILVHTKTDNLSEPFAKLLRSFLTPLENLLSSDFCDKGDEVLDKFDDSKKVKSSISHEHYATFRQNPELAKHAAHKGQDSFTDFSANCDSENLDKSERIALFMSILRQYELTHKGEFREKNSPQGLRWSVSEPYWIRTNRGFITFVKKTDRADVISLLKTALVKWHPTPSRLLSAQLRAEIESQGGVFEDRLLSQKHVAWMFYRKLTTGKPLEQESIIHDEIRRQMEHYTDSASTNLVEFGKKIVQSDSCINSNESQHSNAYGIDASCNDERNKALDHFNSFVSCKPRTGNHLFPGHIFTLEDKTWVVLSPACDLVPGRNKSIVHFDAQARVLPFIAARLFDESNDIARKKATSTNYLFLSQNDDSVRACRFFGSENDDTRVPQSSYFFSKNDGQFDHSGILQLIVFSGTSDQIESRSVDAELHACQLRYEYALNLMAKLGSHTTRIGLGYLGPSIFNSS